VDLVSRVVQDVAWVSVSRAQRSLPAAEMAGVSGSFLRRRAMAGG